MSTANDQTQMQSDDVSKIDRLGAVYQELKNELGKVIVGQNDVIERLAICLFARGHALLMGVPGLAKTLLISSLSETMSLDFSRIQFTPDLMPMDITGTDIFKTARVKENLNSSKALCSQTSFWQTRSTVLRLKPKRQCLRRCRNTKSPRQERRLI